jgi:2-keto-4-pentenoate hydratase/2-oxohepta-3-ene-1,7-dioic acid hydratase in catechol pathway
MKFCNFYFSASPTSRPIAGVLLDGGIAPLFQLIPEVDGVADPESGRPLPMGAMIEETNTLVNLEEWRLAVLSVDEQLQAMTELIDPDTVRFAPPVWQPNSFRDFYAFEEHVKTARARRELEVVPEWYEIPVFYFSNHRAFITHGDELKFPAGGEWLDYELEVAAIVSAAAADLSEETAETCIGGYCLLNDWSLRDAQRQEMKVGLGPAKGKDFASGLGPWLVTADELENRRSGKGFDLEMTASVNGRQLSRGNWKSIHYSFAEMVARASQNVTLYPGDIIGSGTVGSGCILELGPEQADGWLKRGDSVELKSDILGTMRNSII